MSATHAHSITFFALTQDPFNHKVEAGETAFLGEFIILAAERDIRSLLHHKESLHSSSKCLPPIQTPNKENCQQKNYGQHTND